MKTPIATTALLVALAAVALAPAASAESATVQVGENTVEYDGATVACRTTPFSTGPAFRDRVWSDGECDVNADVQGPLQYECRTQPKSTGPLFSFRVWVDRDCTAHARL